MPLLGWSKACALLLVALSATSGSAPLAWTYTTGNYAWAVAVSSDGRYVIAGSDDMHTYFFKVDTSDGKPRWTHSAGGYARHVTISKDGSVAVSSDTAGNVDLFQSDRSETPVWSFHSTSAIDAVDLSEDASHVIAGDREGNLYLFDTNQSGQPIWHSAIEGGFTNLALLGKGLVAASRRGGIYFYDLASSQSSYSWSFHESTSFSQLVVSEGSSYIFAGGSDGYVYVISSSGQVVGSQRLGGSVSAISISQGAHVVVAGSTNGNLSQYSMNDRLLSTGSIHAQAPITSVVVSDGGERIAIATMDGTISMFSRKVSDPLWAYKVGAIVHSLSMSGNGMITAAASDNGSIYVFNERIQVQAQGLSPPILVIAIAMAAALIVYSVWRRKNSRSKMG